jgi:hypothetical protein
MIKFENEKAFEDMLFSHARETMIDPIYNETVIYGIRQPIFGGSGIGDILLVTEREPFRGDKKIRSLNLIELKIQPLISSHIAQICKYRMFLEGFDVAQSIGATDYRYTVINPYSEISPEVFHLAESCNVDIRYYKMLMSGIKFFEYESTSINEDSESAAMKLIEAINKEIN